jgi:hypothetical protein
LNVGAHPRTLDPAWAECDQRSESGTLQAAACARCGIHRPACAQRRPGPSATAATADALAASNLANDDDAQVRLAAILALADMPATEAAGRRVAQLAIDSGNTMRDRWLADAGRQPRRCSGRHVPTRR